MIRLLAAVLACVTVAAHAQSCLPAEAEGTGSKIRRAADPHTYNGVVVWTCPDGRVEWLGVRDTASELAIPNTPERVRAWLSMLRVKHGYDKLGMADLKPMVERAR